MRVIFLFLAIITFYGRVDSAEVTDLSWDDVFSSTIIATAYEPSAQTIECTAFFNDKPIGGGFSFTSGGVARVNIKVPKKYDGTQGISVTCKKRR